MSDAAAAYSSWSGLLARPKSPVCTYATPPSGGESSPPVSPTQNAPLVQQGLRVGGRGAHFWRVLLSLAGHVLDAIVDVVGDVAVVGVVQDHQAGQQHGVLQPVHWQRHEGVPLPLVVQDQRQQGHHQHEDDRAAE